MLRVLLLAFIIAQIENKNLTSSSLKPIVFKENQFFSIFIQFLNVVNQQRNYDSLILLNKVLENDLNCPLNFIAPKYGIPILIANDENQNDFEYRNIFSKETIILSCAIQPEHFFINTKKKLLRRLNNVRYVVYLELSDPEELHDFCEQSFSVDIYNIAIILNSIKDTKSIYTCRKYPASLLSYREIQLRKPEIIFENQFLNMYGANISAYLDLVYPITILYVDKTGSKKLLGYGAKLLHTFAERHNATLRYTIPPSHNLRWPTEISIGNIQNGTVDVLISLYKYRHEHVDYLSYPYEVLNYCFMIPLPRQIPIKLTFFAIIHWEILIGILLLTVIFGILLLYSIKGIASTLHWSTMLLNDRGLRAMLGQPFPLVKSPSAITKFIYFQPFTANLIINTMYQSFLQSALTSAPTEPFIHDHETIEAAHLKIFIMDHAYKTYYEGAIDPEYLHLYHFVPDMAEFVNKRDSLDTNFAYHVLPSRWEVYNEQQKYFSKKLFYYSNTLCMSQYLLFSIPMRVNLPYSDLFNEFILQIHDSGIYDHWLSENFYDMVKAKLTSFKDPTEIKVYGRALNIDDLSRIFEIFASCMALNLVIFGLEIIIFRIKGGYKKH